MFSSLVEIVENLGSPRVLVVGDLILDRYIWGDAERISQEAPVVLLRADRREERLGGAASVASMLAALRANVCLAGVVGDDLPAQCTRNLLDQSGIDHQLVYDDPDRPTTVKERYMGRAQQKHPQQMMRVDYEDRSALEDGLADRLARDVEQRLDQFDIVLISDYDKGVCTPRLLRRIITACRQKNLRVLIDPIRGGNYGIRYRGCSAMTPNRLEASLAAGQSIVTVEDAVAAAVVLRRELEMDVGLITLDRDGMLLAVGDGPPHHFPAKMRQVYDITGAGDMVLAVLGIALAAGATYPQAVELANVAGGLEVERLGVATLSREEILRDLLKQSAGRTSKIRGRDELTEELDIHRRAGQSIVFTNGCFDILHAGHVHYLREAKAQGDVLVVGLNTDDSVRRLGKGTDRPINDEQSRATVLSALDCVDYVCLFNESTPLALIQSVRPLVLVKGADYAPQDVVGRAFVESIGGRLHLATLVPGKSTTSTLQAIRTRAA